MSDKIKVVDFKAKNDLAEIYQQVGFLFAFVSAPINKEYKMCHQWVKCRDFLHDAVRTQITGNKSSIYGFEFEKGVNPAIDMEAMRMLVSTDKCENFDKKIQYALKMLNHFEEVASVELSKVEKVEVTGSKKKSVFMFSSPSMWLYSPFLVSMYSLIIRVGDKMLDFEDEATLKEKLEEVSLSYKSSKVTDNDSKYISKSWDKLHDVLRNAKTLFPEKDGLHDLYFDNSVNISNFHNNCGIYSLCEGRTPITELNTHMKGKMAMPTKSEPKTELKNEPPVKEVKKKLPVIEKRKSTSSGGYGIQSNSMHFAYVAAEGDKRMLATGAFTCREYMCLSVLHNVCNSEPAGHISNFEVGRDAKIDMEKLRLLIMKSCTGKEAAEAFKKKLFKAKAVLNILEDLAGFEKSKIMTAKSEAYPNCWLITGPKEWMSQPQLISLVLWVLRVVAGAGDGIDVTNYDSVEKGLFDITLLPEKESYSTVDTHIFTKALWDKLYILLKYHKEIFGDITIAEAYPKEAAGGFMSASGVSSFCDPNRVMYSPKTKIAKEKFLALCKEHLPRKNPLLEGKTKTV